MSEAKGVAMGSMIQDFICPRIYAALGLESVTGCPISIDEQYEEKTDKNI